MTSWTALALERLALREGRVEQGASPIRHPVPLAPIAPLAPELAEKPTYRSYRSYRNRPAHIHEEAHSDYPSPFAADLAKLLESNPTVDDERWRQACDDAEVLLHQWGETAVALGWSVEDLFGLHETAPFARYDVMGLVWALRGRRVILMDSTSAKLTGGLVWRRAVRPSP
jgi:hypothetical protein